MRITRRTGWLQQLGPVLAAAGTLGTAWAWDVRRRDGQTALVHRTLVDLLLNAISAGDSVTERHSRRVADLTDVLGGMYRLPRARRARLRVASLLHDLGKIDDRFFHIVHGYEALSEEQRRKIEQHPDESAHILEPMERIHPGITAIVEAHHECWNGKGYPRGLRGDEIPLEARLISVADVFDALTQPRGYRDPLPVERALEEVGKGAGQRFDPEVIRRLQTSPGALRRWREIAEEGRRNEAVEATRSAAG